MTTSNQNQFIASVIEEAGHLTPQQAAQLLEMGEGDTGALTPEEGSAPNAVTADPITSDPAPKTDTTDPVPPDSQLTADTAVILAKDGKHTISYDKLVQSREGERTARAESEQLRARVAEAEQKLADLQAQAQARVSAGQAPTAADNQLAAAQAAIDAGVNPELFGDFSPEAMAKGVTALVAQQVQARVDERMAQIDAQLDAKLKPIEQKAVIDSTTGHYGAIYKAHPDADSIVDSQEFAAWQASMPSVVRTALSAALNGGSTGEVIEVFDAFKKSAVTQAAPEVTPAKPDPVAAAKAAIANAPAPVPASLSDIPGGRVGAANRHEAMAGMSAIDRLDAMRDMTPAQIDDYLNSQI